MTGCHNLVEIRAAELLEGVQSVVKAGRGVECLFPAAY